MQSLGMLHQPTHAVRIDGSKPARNEALAAQASSALSYTDLPRASGRYLPHMPGSAAGITPAQT